MVLLLSVFWNSFPKMYLPIFFIYTWIVLERMFLPNYLQAKVAVETVLYWFLVLYPLLNG
jgi:hypothetical protein